MICKHMFKRPRTTAERRQYGADRADRLPVRWRVRARWRPTHFDDLPMARRSCNDYRHRRRR